MTIKYSATTNISSKLKIALKCDLQEKKISLLPGTECTNCPGGVEAHYTNKEYNGLKVYKQLDDADVPIIRSVIAEINGCSDNVIIANDYMIGHAGCGWYSVTQLPPGWDGVSEIPVTSIATEGYGWAGGDRTAIYRSRRTGVLNIPANGGEILYTPTSVSEADTVIVGEKVMRG